MCPAEPTDFGNVTAHHGWAVQRAPLDCPMPGPAPGGHPALGCSVTFSHLLWRANGIVGCWAMPALSSSSNTGLCCWAGPGRGWQSVNLCLFFSSLVRTSAPCLVLRSWPLLSHSESVVCFPMEYKTGRRLSCTLLTGRSQREPQILGAILKGASLFPKNILYNFYCSAMEKYMPSRQAFAQDEVIGIPCSKQQSRASNPEMYTELSSGI